MWFIYNIFKYDIVFISIQNNEVDDDRGETKRLSNEDVLIKKAVPSLCRYLVQGTLRHFGEEDREKDRKVRLEAHERH